MNNRTLLDFFIRVLELVIYGIIFILGLMLGERAKAAPLATQHSVIRIDLSKDSDEYRATGFLTYDGNDNLVVVSNAHVCNRLPPPNLNWRTPNGRHLVPLKIDYTNDLCSLSTTAKRGDIPLQLADKFTENGTKTTCGYPSSTDLLTCKTGKWLANITGVHPADEEGLPPVVAMCNVYSFAAEPGQSGSPVMNSSGEVIGVIWARAALDSNHAIVMQLKALRRFLGYGAVN